MTSGAMSDSGDSPGADQGGVAVPHQTTASPAQVWAVLADGWTYAAWVVGTSRIRAVDATWPQPGSRVHHSVGSWPLLLNDETEVLEATAPGHLVLQARGRPVGEARVSIDVRPTGAGATITIREDATHGPTRLLPAALRQLVVIPRNRESLRRLAYLAERDGR